MKRVIVLLTCFVSSDFLFALPSARSDITIDTVRVGNVGNANDPATGNLYGGVNYAYNIGKYEVTVGQYTVFLNAVAAVDTYNLYNTSMATDPQIAGISRTGSSGSYSYDVIGSPNHPATYVSWGDAARFANWMHNGQPSGAQDVNTTENGAYPLNGARTDEELIAFSRNAGARWFIPSENEWYKAAYYQPAGQGGDADNYWAYPTRTNSEPNSDQPPGAFSIRTNVANFFRNDGVTNGINDGFAVTGSTTDDSFQNYLTDVGAYTSASSFYGTFDQGGNVYEWNEAVFLGNRLRGRRGGSMFNDSSEMLSSSRRRINPSGFGSVFGFRVANVPEPSTIVLATLGALGPVLLRKRFRSN